MRLLNIIQRIRLQKQVLSLGLPLGIFLIMVGVGFGTGDSIGSNGEPDTAVVVASATSVPVATATTQPTTVPTSEPTATVIPDRTTCSEIQGTDYQSATEQAWYLANCVTATTAESQTVSEQPQAAVANTVSNPAPVSGYVGAQTALGDRLVIPSIGVNTDVSSAVVGVDGVMPDPSGYFNVVWYDFQNHPGLGGYASGGNLVLAGHVDSAVYGAVVFYNLSQLQVGEIIEYYTSDGQVFRYEVTGAGDYLPTDNWSAIVGSSTADITLITCNGSFNTSVAGEYSHRRAVFGKRI